MARTLNNNMALVKFARGPKAAYLPATDHLDYVFFCTDEKAVYVNNVRYGFGDASGVKTVASVEQVNGKAQLLVTYTDNTTATINLNQVKASGEKIISVDTNGYLQSTLGLTYDSTNNKIKLIGISDEVIAQIDTDDFIRDSYLNAAEVVSEKPHPTDLDPDAVDHGTWLKLTWITSDGEGTAHEITYVDVSNLVDMYVAETGNDATLTITSTGSTDSLTGAATKLIKISDTYKAKINAAATDADLQAEITNRTNADSALEAALKGNSSTDDASSLTLEGVKKYAAQQAAAAQTNAESTAAGYDAALETTLIGTSNDAASADTINGAKNFASAADATLKTEIIGTASDTTSSNTISGAKLYADSLSEAIIGSSSTDTVDSLTLNGLKKKDAAIAADLAQEITDRGTAVATAKSDLIGTSSSASSTDTINGAKKYADEAIIEALTWAELTVTPEPEPEP